MSRVDDGAVGRAVGEKIPRADQESGHFLDRLLRGREADARQPAAGEGLEPLEREREMHSSLGSDHGVNLVDDHRACAREHPPPGLGAEQDVERLGRGDDDVRGALRAARPLVLRGIAGAHEGADFDLRQAERGELRADARERRLEVALDVVGERLERGDVHHQRLVRQSAGGDASAHQLVDRREECGERLARARRGGDQHVSLRRNHRPGRALGRRRSREGAREPPGDGRMKLGGHEGIEAQSRRHEESATRDSCAVQSATFGVTVWPAGRRASTGKGE